MERPPARVFTMTILWICDSGYVTRTFVQTGRTVELLFSAEDQHRLPLTPREAIAAARGFAAGGPRTGALRQPSSSNNPPASSTPIPSNSGANSPGGHRRGKELGRIAGTAPAALPSSPVERSATPQYTGECLPAFCATGPPAHESRPLP